MGAGDLTTLAAVEQYLSPPMQSGNADEPVLSALITAASAFMVNYVGWPVLSGSFTENRNGTGGRAMTLKNRPVTAVSSLTIDGNAIAASSGFGTQGYWISDDGKMILLRGYRFSRGEGNVQIQYTAGYASCPPDLQMAVNSLVALRFKERKHLDTRSESVNGAQTISFVVTDLTPAMRMVIDNYRRVAPGVALMPVTVRIEGQKQVIAHLKSMGDATRQGIRRAVIAAAIDVQQRVREKLAGEVLNERTHHLHDSIHEAMVQDDARSIVETVGTDVAYAAFWEYGFSGTENVREHLRRIDVAFGKPIAPVEVLVRAHTRQVDQAPRSFLRSSLAELAPQIRDRIEGAVQQAIKP